MGALANFIERAGVATTSISLIRPQSERVGPPRALWVPYALGRPLGSAGDPDFQKDVMRAAFDLLANLSEPAIVDYEVEATFQHRLMTAQDLVDSFGMRRMGLSLREHERFVRAAGYNPHIYR